MPDSVSWIYLNNCHWAYGMNYEILIIHFCIFILTDPNQFQLIDCVTREEADTSLCLQWENKIFVHSEQFKDCEETKITYEFKCGKNLTLIRGVFFFFFPIVGSFSEYYLMIPSSLLSSTFFQSLSLSLLHSPWYVWNQTLVFFIPLKLTKETDTV